MSLMERPELKFPLPQELTPTNRRETVCQYCGVSYLIHNEIKRLESYVADLEMKLSENTTLWPEKYRELQEDVEVCSSKFLSQQALYESEIVELKQKTETLQCELKEKNSVLLCLEKNIKHATSNYQELVRALCATSNELHGTQIQLEKMKVEADIYDRLKDDLNKLKIGKFHSFLKLLNDGTTEDSLNGTVDYLESVGNIAKQHIKKLDGQIEKMAYINDTLSHKLSDAMSKLKKLKEENEKCYKNEEIDNRTCDSPCDPKIQNLELENENLKRIIQRFTTEFEKLQVSLRNLKAENNNLMAERGNLQLNIDVMKANEQVILKALEESKNEFEQARAQSEYFEKKVRSAKEKIESFTNKENEMKTKVGDIRTSYEDKIHSIQQDFENRHVSVLNEVERLRNSLAEKEMQFQTKLEEKESLIRYQYSSRLETLSEDLRSNLITAKQNEDAIHARWNTKLNECREQMRGHMACLEKQIEISTNDSLARNNRLLRERAQLKAKVSTLEAELQETRRKFELELLERGKRLERVLEDHERSHEEAEYLKTNLAQKDKMIEVLQETVQKECEEREDILRRLEDIRKDEMKAANANRAPPKTHAVQRRSPCSPAAGPGAGRGQRTSATNSRTGSGQANAWNNRPLPGYMQGVAVRLPGSLRGAFSPAGAAAPGSKAAAAAAPAAPAFPAEREGSAAAGPLRSRPSSRMTGAAAPGNAASKHAAKPKNEPYEFTIGKGRTNRAEHGQKLRNKAVRMTRRNSGMELDDGGLD